MDSVEGERNFSGAEEGTWSGGAGEAIDICCKASMNISYYTIRKVCTCLTDLVAW